MKLSANLGFLWTELSLPEAIYAAAKAGFDAVECHSPYDHSIEEIKAALLDTQLPMLGLNTARGKQDGDKGVCAIPGRENEARELINEAIHYANRLNVTNIHVMAGNAKGQKAHDTFLSNLVYASTIASSTGKTILIEPLNSYDAPDYFLKTSEQAKNIINCLKKDNVKMMFDCYHIQLMEGDLINRLRKLKPIIGHIQIADVPSRNEPGEGEIDYRFLLRAIDSMGFTHPVGVEYKPKTSTEEGLGWRRKLGLQ